MNKFNQDSKTNFQDCKKVHRFNGDEIDFLQEQTENTHYPRSNSGQLLNSITQQHVRLRSNKIKSALVKRNQKQYACPLDFL